jgi:hypothetical protein
MYWNKYVTLFLIFQSWLNSINKKLFNWSFLNFRLKTFLTIYIYYTNSNNSPDIITVVYLRFEVKYVEISQSLCVKNSLKTSHEKKNILMHCLKVIFKSLNYKEWHIIFIHIKIEKQHYINALIKRSFPKNEET